MATIETYNYDSNTKELSLVFGYDTNTVYIYSQVPRETYDGLDLAQSKGKFYHAQIKDKFNYRPEDRD